MARFSTFKLNKRNFQDQMCLMTGNVVYLKTGFWSGCDDDDFLYIDNWVQSDSS
jgi:hypothetical protein